MNDAMIDYQRGQGTHRATILRTRACIEEYKENYKTYGEVVERWYMCVDRGDVLIVNSRGGYFDIPHKMFVEKYLVDWV